MKKQLTVLLPVHVFFPNHFYGTETYTLELAQCLRRWGHNPVILTGIPFGEEGPGTLRSVYQYDGFTVHCLDMNAMPYERFKDTYHRPALYPVLRDIVFEVGPDIVHVTHLIHHTSTLLEVLRDLKIPAVATLTDFYGFCFTNILEGHNGVLCKGPNRRSTNCLCCYLRRAEWLANHPVLKPFIDKNTSLRALCSALPFLARLPQVKKIFDRHIQDITERVKILRPQYQIYRAMVAPTDFLYDAYVENDFYPEKLIKINFGINLDLVKDYQPTKDGSTVRFGYIGQIAPHKGVDLLIDAFHAVTGTKKSLVIYGSQEQDPPYAQKLLEHSAQSERISFGGTFPREELPYRLSEIDILVIPSRWHENSPLVLLYALATKTPVIVSNVKGMTEFVHHGVNGFTFSMNNLKELIHLMQQIVDDPESISRLSANASYEKDVSDHAGEILEVYRDALSADS